MSLPCVLNQSYLMVSLFYHQDGGGSISKDELAELMDTLGIETSAEELDAMVKE